MVAIVSMGDPRDLTLRPHLGAPLQGRAKICGPVRGWSLPHSRLRSSGGTPIAAEPHIDTARAPSGRAQPSPGFYFRAASALDCDVRASFGPSQRLKRRSASSRPTARSRR